MKIKFRMRNWIIIQKLVIKVSMNNHTSGFHCFGPQSPHSKALKLVGGFRDRIEVTGDVDAINLTNLLRKKVGYAEIVTVSKAGKKDKKESESKDKVAQRIMSSYVGGVPHCQIAYLVDPCPRYSEPSCSIM
ncbi:hypothetical protein ACJRO7_007168 [Eucalyptus globulus]|uniref:HMA domain-containing protein n=1 Tax=Eucalyptus globulus TaxID=34317 RepID=A0ABD3IL73_EUCGL